MTKSSSAPGVLKKIISRLIRQAPSGGVEKIDPLARLVRAFLEYDADLARAQSAESRLLTAMADYNELRVTPVMEMVALLGVRYPFADTRSQALRRTLQAIFEREHHMSLEGLKAMKKPEVRKYLQTLTAIPAYVEAAVALECFGIHACPVDTKLLLWMIHKGALPQGTTIPEAQQLLEKHVRAESMLPLHRGARKELESWSPKVWPAPTKVVLPPPPAVAPPSAAPELPAEEKPRPAGESGEKKTPSAAPTSGGKRRTPDRVKT